ncbi:MAG: sulfatase-like hydrolase/transferase [Candidatus Staskawiczbacteria bacterium]|nr:sulfatase-like hydrolase/transferase [Candidatus Staskawiczbacteria bacterium]
MDFNLLISVILSLLAVGIFLLEKIEISKLKKALFCCGVFLSVLSYVIYYAINYFTGEGIDNSVIYSFYYGFDGAGYSAYMGLIVTCVILILIGTAFSFWLFFRKNHIKKFNKKTTEDLHFYTGSVMLLVLSLFFNPVVVSLWENFVSEIKVAKIDKNSDFYTVYENPKIKQTGKAKNLVFIYAESLERTYFDNNIFPGLTKNLQNIESNSISFTNVDQIGYSAFTIGGMVASQCGIPLIAKSKGSSMYGMDSYLAGATCFGDLLNKEGYYLSFLGGARGSFSGKANFYSSHKFNEVFGRNELLSLLPDPKYLNSWGLYDDALFDIDYEKFIQLSETKKKFALLTLTVDTHGPKGSPSKSCESIIYKDGTNPSLNAVACSDYLISNFINKIRKSKYSANTVIVLVSDHLAAGDNTATDLLKSGNRRDLFMINLPKASKGIKINKLASTLDTDSTILPFIGYKGNIGLGRDIINRKESDSQIKNIGDSLSRWTQYILQFWNFPKIKDHITVQDKEIYIDDRSFKTPVLIELDDKLQTNLFFEFDVSINVGLNYYVTNMDKNQSFILINKCTKINDISSKKIDYKGYCLLAGRGNEIKIYAKVTDKDPITINTEAIRKFTGLPSQ